MSEVTTYTQWSTVDAQWVDTDPECSVIAITLKSNGEHYTVACSGPKGMKSNQFINAMRVAAAACINVNGGDISTVGAKIPDAFDTGDQRAN